ncbi:PAB-dependent poly(A)-specific ribonuclease subunit 3 [Pseudogymnoascus verrucosus]|uniref:PAN2-PAN3 deadenylation complex subunit PAN3 n=1 Tax=Pseudogymnoascus verrucosus TaxID=342668 RepID=A0A1B8GDS0_9PEZI|nr:PAB-dependent poly(A)-specific ribonuclease subunit 3 [Pseudogymnoascus verrucosus]OBT93978.2 PAB-dependent poly(A)-specific ribonuclease subunit 3 [Pseudogymnoascus verrucosus]
MATTRFVPGQKAVGSPRPKGRENAKDTLCRNVLIYGHCRYEDQGCAFNHEPNKAHTTQTEMSKKSLNVDSPSFTPIGLANTSAGLSAMSSRAASAAPFTPRSAASGTATPTQQEDAVSFNPAQIREFTPQNYDLNTSTLNGGGLDAQVPFDPFTIPNSTQAVPAAQYNPYLEDTSAGASAAYYPGQASYAATAQPLQYHLYAPMGPHREDLLAYQRLPHDFFMPEKLREELQRKSEASLQTMPNSQLPTLDNYHSLVALDTSHHKSATVFGYPSWVYKATSSKNGNLYCLRRLEGYRLTNEKAIRSVKEWRRVDCGGVVTVLDAFTTRAFGDSSLIFVTDYHPLAKTLVETHFSTANRFGNRVATTVPEQVLWGYIVQISAALKSVHASNLAVRCLEPSKVLVTDKNRVRLSACAVLDVVHHDIQRSLQELQQDDLQLFGKLILALGTNSLLTQQNMKVAVEQLGRIYSTEVRDTVLWLLTPAVAPATKSIDEFLCGISSHVVSSLDSAFHQADSLTSELSRELENGRLARLLMKLGTINERQEYEGERSWSEHGERYMLKLFRDYVFHQVDALGNPVLDIGHMIRCLNKLDAGVDEKILLTSRDDQTSFVVSYKELKKQVAAAFGDLMKPAVAKPNRQF